MVRKIAWFIVGALIPPFLLFIFWHLVLTTIFLHDNYAYLYSYIWILWFLLCIFITILFFRFRGRNKAFFNGLIFSLVLTTYYAGMVYLYA